MDVQHPTRTTPTHLHTPMYLSTSAYLSSTCVRPRYQVVTSCWHNTNLAAKKNTRVLLLNINAVSSSTMDPSPTSSSSATTLPFSILPPIPSLCSISFYRIPYRGQVSTAVLGWVQGLLASQCNGRKTEKEGQSQGEAYLDTSPPKCY